MRCECCTMGKLETYLRKETIEYMNKEGVIGHIIANNIPVHVCNLCCNVFIMADTLHTRQKYVDEALKKEENNASV